MFIDGKLLIRDGNIDNQIGIYTRWDQINKYFQLFHNNAPIFTFRIASNNGGPYIPKLRYNIGKIGWQFGPSK